VPPPKAKISLFSTRFAAQDYCDCPSVSRLLCSIQVGFPPHDAPVLRLLMSGTAHGRPLENSGPKIPI